MSVRWITADVFDGLATIDTGSVDLVVTSPPFLALRSYLPADHPDKGKEIGSEASPADWLDVMLRWSAELRRVLAPHGSIAVELGDTYSGSSGNGSGWHRMEYGMADTYAEPSAGGLLYVERDLSSWPLAKSKTLIPELYRIALAYGINPLTGQESPAGRWRIRNVVTWARPNPPVGALGDKWRPATSDVVVACVSDKRYWDDLATRKDTNNSHATSRSSLNRSAPGYHTGEDTASVAPISDLSKGAPLLDYWEIPPGGYPGSHYAVFPPALVEPLVKAMCPERVCRTCGEPSRRITEVGYVKADGGHSGYRGKRDIREPDGNDRGLNNAAPTMIRSDTTVGWSTCGHDDYRPGVVLDPFAGSGTTLAVATGHGHTAIGIDLDERNEVLARDRVGSLLWGDTALRKENQ